MIKINKEDKPTILAALYNNSRPLGMGILHFTPEEMTKEEAAELLKSQTYFDYLKGRVMKVGLDGDEFDQRLYDRDNGEGSAARAIESALANV